MLYDFQCRYESVKIQRIYIGYLRSNKCIYLSIYISILTMYLSIQAKITDDEDNTGMFAMLSEFKQALAVKKPETGRIKIISGIGP